MEENKELEVLEETEKIKGKANKHVEGVDQCYEDVVLDLKYYHGMIELLCDYGRMATCVTQSDSQLIELEAQVFTFEVLAKGLEEIIAKLDKYA